MFLSTNLTLCAIYGTIQAVKKIVLIDKRAQKELNAFPHGVQLKFAALFQILEQSGKLEEPFAKKLAGKEKLFEVRVKYLGQWRGIYAYIESEHIIILSAFAKKTQKTPSKELELARRRLTEYEQ